MVQASTSRFYKELYKSTAPLIILFLKYQYLVLVFSLFIWKGSLFIWDLTFSHKSICTWNSGELGLLALQPRGHSDVLPPHWSFDNIRTNGKAFPEATLGRSLLILPVLVVDCAKGNVWPGSQATLLSKLINLRARSDTRLRICFLVVTQGSSIDFRQLCRLIIASSLEKCRPG